MKPSARLSWNFLIGSTKSCLPSAPQAGASARIIDVAVDKVLARIKAKEVRIELDQSAREFLIGKAYDSYYGTQPMRRVIKAPSPGSARVGISPRQCQGRRLHRR